MKDRDYVVMAGKTEEEKEALKKAHREGKNILVLGGNGEWYDCLGPQWQNTCCYKVADEPEVEVEEDILLDVYIEDGTLYIAEKSDECIAILGAGIWHQGKDYTIISFKFTEFKEEPISPIAWVSDEGEWSFNKDDNFPILAIAKQARCRRLKMNKRK